MCFDYGTIRDFGVLRGRFARDSRVFSEACGKLASFPLRTRAFSAEKSWGFLPSLPRRAREYSGVGSVGGSLRSLVVCGPVGWSVRRWFRGCFVGRDGPWGPWVFLCSQIRGGARGSVRLVGVHDSVGRCDGPWKADGRGSVDGSVGGSVGGSGAYIDFRPAGRIPYTRRV